jgi:hypothetical protein
MLLGDVLILFIKLVYLNIIYYVNIYRVNWIWFDFLFGKLWTLSIFFHTKTVKVKPLCNVS